MITAMTLGAELLHARARPVRPLQGVMEPNGKKTAELCVAANYTQRFGSSGANGNAWGYMDSSCTSKFIFMCRIMRERRGRCLVSHWAFMAAVMPLLELPRATQAAQSRWPSPDRRTCAVLVLSSSTVGSMPSSARQSMP